VVKIIQEPYSDFSTAYYSSEVLEYRWMPNVGTFHKRVLNVGEPFGLNLSREIDYSDSETFGFVNRLEAMLK
jgi:hypothetical protein